MGVGESYMRQCWADRAPNHRCRHGVPTDPDHIGLCEQHRALFRQMSHTNDPEHKARWDGPQTEQGRQWAQEMTA